MRQQPRPACLIIITGLKWCTFVTVKFCSKVFICLLATDVPIENSSAKDQKHSMQYKSSEWLHVYKKKPELSLF